MLPGLKILARRSISVLARLLQSYQVRYDYILCRRGRKASLYQS